MVAEVVKGDRLAAAGSVAPVGAVVEPVQSHAGANVARHQRTRPYTPRHNGKVERYQRTLAQEFFYARIWPSEDQRNEAIKIWNVHYNYHRPHTAAADQPPASRLATGVTNVLIGNT